MGEERILQTEPDAGWAKKRFRLAFFFLLLFISIFVWGWIFWPQYIYDHHYTVPTIQSPLLTAVGKSDVGVIEEGAIEARLSYPVKAHLGDDIRVRLTLIPVDHAYGARISDGSFHLVAEARLDFPLLEITPGGTVQQPFDFAEPRTFQWKIDLNDNGLFEGQFWMYILIVSSQGETERQAVLAVPMTLEARDFLGLNEHILVWPGLAFLFSALLVYPRNIKKQ